MTTNLDNPAADPPAKPDQARLRRVLIEDRQQMVLDQVRGSAGYSDDVDPHAHDRKTFRLINQRKELDRLPHAAIVVPALDNWKHWTKMGDWDSRNALLEQLTNKLRRRETTPAEIEILVVVCRPAWAKVASSLRRYGGADLDTGAEGLHRREEASRVNELDRDELGQVVQHGLLDALSKCPRPFPRYFFKWLEVALAHRALDHVRTDLTEHANEFPLDKGIREVVEAALADAVPGRRRRSGHRPPPLMISGCGLSISPQSSIYRTSTPPTHAPAAPANGPLNSSPIVSAR